MDGGNFGAIEERCERLRRGAEREVCRVLRRATGKDAAKHQLAMWVFVYNPSADLLLHCDLFHPTDERFRDHAVVKESQILGGSGTIGFVQKKTEAEIVADTFDDPRGAVAIQDTIISNYSWCGIPVVPDSDPEALVIASFFPVSKEEKEVRWPDERDILYKIKNRLFEYVHHGGEGEESTQHKETLVMLRDLSRLQEANSLLTTTFSYEKRAPYDHKVSTMLRRTLSLGAPFTRLRNAVYLEETRAQGEGQGISFACSDASFLRCDVRHRRVEILRKLQWESLRGAGAVDWIFPGEYRIVDVPQVREESEKPNVWISLYLRAATSEAQGIVEAIGSYFATWREVFTALVELYDTELQDHIEDRKVKKKVNDSAALLFSVFAEPILREYYDGVEERAETVLEGAIEVCRGLLPAREEGRLDGLMGSFRGAANRLRSGMWLVRESILGLSLYFNCQEWSLHEAQAIDETGYHQLQEPGNWKVFQRAVSQQDCSVLHTYRPFHWPTDGGSWSLEGEGHPTSRTLRTNGIAIQFERRKSAFPIDFQICPTGYARQLYDVAGGLRFKREVCDAKFGNYTQRSYVLSDTDPELDGRYAELAEEDGRVVLAGPIGPIDASKGVESSRMPPETVREFVKKELTVVLLAEYAKQVTSASLRAAVAAIMGRNASHNLGSHVLARHSSRRIDKDDSTISLVTELKDGQFLDRYIQGRMDYVAQVATEWPAWTEPARLVGEILWGLLAQRVVLQEIVASEGLGALEWERSDDEEIAVGKGREGEIRLHCFRVSRPSWAPGSQVGDIAERRSQARALLFHEHHKDNEFRSSVDLSWDPLVAIPGGVTGWHAVYVILENVIRNSAKHGRFSSSAAAVGGRPVDFVFEFLDVSATEGEIEEKALSARGRYACRLYDNISFVEEGEIESINRALAEPLLDSGGAYRKSNWGFAEMAIAATYLQRGSLDLLGPNAAGLAVRSEEDEQKGSRRVEKTIKAILSPIGTLGYEFWLLRPRRLEVYGGQEGRL